MKIVVEGGRPLRGTLRVPSDKSIAHRALLLAARLRATSRIRATGVGEDVRSTIRLVRAIGAGVEPVEGGFLVRGGRPVKPTAPIDCGNSGTTMRIGSGLIAGWGLGAELVGDASLSRRPMGRICAPLRKLGAEMEGIEKGRNEVYPPLRIRPSRLRGGQITVVVPSAQVKSAVLFAGFASGRAVEVFEPLATRDHTERLLAAMGAPLEVSEEGEGRRVRLGACAGDLYEKPLSVDVPGDFSSAAYWIAAASLVEGSHVVLEEVGFNPTRTGMLRVLEEASPAIEVHALGEWNGEPVATLEVRPSRFRSRFDETLVLGGAIIPRMVDELVVLAPLLARLPRRSEVRDARDLRNKESDRIAATVDLLRAFGGYVDEREDGFVIRRPMRLRPARVRVQADHRVALTALVLALAAPGRSSIEGFEIASVSYPGAIDAARALGARIWVEP